MAALDRNEPKEQDSIYRAVFRAMQQPFLVLQADLTVHLANPAFHDHFQVAPEETEGRSLYDLGNGQWDIPALRDLLTHVAQKHETVEDYRFDHEFERLGRRSLLLNAEPIVVEGELDQILLAVRDITEAEAHEEFQEKLIDAVREGLVVLRMDGLRIEQANQSFYEMFGMEPSDVEGKPIYEVGKGQWDIPELRRLLEEIVPENARFDDYEVTADFAGLGRRTMLLNARRIDHLDAILLAIRDVTEERHRREKESLLVGELQHRVKNILNNVLALVRQTKRAGGSVEAFAEAFAGRVHSLARVQDLLVRGPGEAIGLETILHTEFKAHGAEEGEDYRLDGPDVRLANAQAQALTMAVYELITNAAKHGALAQEEGRVEVSWSCTREEGSDQVELVWRERGVRIAEQPSNRGFGSEIIEKSLPYLLGGRSELTFHEDGVECIVVFPPAGPGHEESERET